ncbi:MAG: isoprenylcysteine carboxylmethyltransferase family protein, partial [Candidatus Nanohaloarchaea archaeon]
WMIVGLLISVFGMILVALGWYRIYNEDDDLVTTGIYSYSRHPQYLGIILIALGWVIGWPTILTTVLFPILVYTYYKNTIEEEKEVKEELGDEKYEEYAENTPRLI